MGMYPGMQRPVSQLDHPPIRLVSAAMIATCTQLVALALLAVSNVAATQVCNSLMSYIPFAPEY